MDDEEYYKKIRKINRENLYKQINKNKSDKWENFEITGRLEDNEKKHEKDKSD
jgi:hypothetical protein